MSYATLLKGHYFVTQSDDINNYLRIANCRLGHINIINHFHLHINFNVYVVHLILHLKKIYIFYSI